MKVQWQVRIFLVLRVGPLHRASTKASEMLEFFAIVRLVGMLTGEEHSFCRRPSNLGVQPHFPFSAPHRSTSPFPNHAAPQHNKNHFRSKR
jgi:hypothetical protein